MKAFQNTYAQIDSRLYQPAKAMTVEDPEGFLFNASLHSELQLLDEKDIHQRDRLLTGQLSFADQQPIALAYAGHQFGHFTMLGDGRALLLGEWPLPHGGLVDIQLKGSGPTPYARRGDGLATISAMCREYLMSECMHYLGIPTTRSLAVTKTRQGVQRETVHEGAMLTRVASSHLRVGTFEYIAQLQDLQLLKNVTDYTIRRHYPDCLKAAQPALAFLKSVIEKQAMLVVDWMRVGFIHGVMNTDNMSLAGETIDYGPCAFMNSYDRGAVFSSIDTQGRYAFGRQAPIAQWNLACLASSLLPLLDTDEAKAIELAQEAISAFVPIFERSYDAMLRRKLGLSQPIDGDAALLAELEAWMQEQRADYTATFWALEHKSMRKHDLFFTAPFEKIYKEVEKLRQNSHESISQIAHTIRRSNPYFIPRNHLVENALTEIRGEGKSYMLQRLMTACQNAYTLQDEFYDLMEIPNEDHTYQTFCGT
jgi:uncharacterized protein YdiU (UPF0061 family)